MSAKPEAKILPSHVSRIEYFALHGSNFHVLSDQSTILGVDFATKKNIFHENIVKSSQPTKIYSKAEATVYTIAVHESNNTILAGEAIARIVQYDLDTTQIMRVYQRKILIEYIKSSVGLGNIWFFGSGIDARFVTLDIRARRLAYNPVKSGIGKIHSMAICKLAHLSGHKVILVLAGQNPLYTFSSKDVYDVTGLFKHYGVNPFK